MNKIQDPRQWFQNLLDQSQNDQGLENIDWLKTLRDQSRNQLAQLPMPQRKHENWRYSKIENLFKIDFDTHQADAIDLATLNIDQLLIEGIDSYRLVVHNGQLIEQLSDIDNLPDGVKLSSMRQALATDADSLSAWFGHANAESQEIFTALNTALANDGLFVHIDAEVKLEKPIEVIYIHQGMQNSTMIQLRNLVVLEQNASASLIERFVSSDSSLCFNNNLSEIVLDASAKLSHYRLVEENRQSYHLGSLWVSQQASSVYDNTTISLGGAWSRTDFNVEFKAQEAQCNLNGLYTVGDQQLIDNHLNIQHKVPNCASQQNFKGILYGQGRAVFDGLIFVDKQAQGTDAHLSNANLMLTRKAEVDTKPQLEIYADDVKCSHGTTVGQLESDQIFYLRSRGIDEDSAHKMLCMGFADEIVNTIDLEALRNHVDDVLQHSLSSIGQNLD